jgi:hypothetical protein
MAKESILLCPLMGVAVAAIMTGCSGGYTPTAAPNIVQVTSKGTRWNFTVENATNLTLVQTTVVSRCMNKVPPNRLILPQTTVVNSLETDAGLFNGCIGKDSSFTTMFQWYNPPPGYYLVDRVEWLGFNGGPFGGTQKVTNSFHRAVPFRICESITAPTRPYTLTLRFDTCGD